MIPIRLDSVVRLENLIMSVDYLYKHFDTNILVLQASKYENHIVPKLLGRKAKYCFIEDFDNIFYRTKYLNYMTKISQTPYLAIWDADVIIPKKQIIEAVAELENGSDIVYPYDGHFYDTSALVRELYVKKADIRILERNKEKMFLLYGNKMIGGAIFVNRQSYISSGMENTNFYGWGPEDSERHIRWKYLGYKIAYIKGHLFHLTHQRGSDSKFRSDDQIASTHNEIIKLVRSNKKEVLNDICIRESQSVDLNQDTSN